MGLLRTLTRPITYPMDKLIASKPFRRIIGLGPFKGIGHLLTNKYTGTGFGLGMIGLGASNLLAGNPLGLLGVVGGAFRVRQANNPLVSKKLLEAAKAQNEQLAIQNSKLKYLGLPLLGAGGLGAGYLLADKDEEDRPRRRR